MTFPGTGVRLTGQLFPRSTFLPFLKMDAMFPFSSHLGLQLPSMTCGRRIEESVQLPTAFAQIVYCRQNEGPAEKEKETEKREAWTTAQDH